MKVAKVSNLAFQSTVLGNAHSDFHKQLLCMFKLYVSPQTEENRAISQPDGASFPQVDVITLLDFTYRTTKDRQYQL
jgi:hypothetical protein